MSPHLKNVAGTLADALMITIAVRRKAAERSGHVRIRFHLASQPTLRGQLRKIIKKGRPCERPFMFNVE